MPAVASGQFDAGVGEATGDTVGMEIGGAVGVGVRGTLGDVQAVSAKDATIPNRKKAFFMFHSPACSMGRQKQSGY